MDSEKRMSKANHLTKELCKGYDLADILNMDESGCFLTRFQRKDWLGNGGVIKEGRSRNKE